MLKIAFFAVVVLASAVQGNFLTDGIEQVSYAAIKDALRSAGKSEAYADCMVNMMKATGVTNDMFDIRSILDPARLVEKLESKAQLADFVCSNGGIGFIIFLSLIFVGLCCCCCAKACGSEREPIIVQVSRSSYPDSKVPYDRIQKV